MQTSGASCGLALAPSTSAGKVLEMASKSLANCEPPISSPVVVSREIEAEAGSSGAVAEEIHPGKFFVDVHLMEVQRQHNAEEVLVTRALGLEAVAPDFAGGSRRLT
ncbi:hypothetical protein Nepgr_021008 [Nepenthes gracilis]|uniref:Uncharacterized protein n=1 Tax=Nepenthes gracilis TaxID=150966 RepID=A0AAD3XVK6_NEPGR|nr:hypothetical protein Nepgr_021008 [Nepenthes gracilis]